MLINWLSNDILPHHLKTMEESLVDFSTILADSISVDTKNKVIDIERVKKTFTNIDQSHFEANIYGVIKTNISMRVYVTDANGIVVFDSEKGQHEGHDYSKWNDVHKTLQGEYGARATRTNPNNAKSLVLYIAAPITSEGTIVGVITVCKPIESVNQFVITARRKLLKGGFIAAFATVLLTIVISSWVTRPIRKLIIYAQEVRDGRRVSAPQLGSSEIGSLSKAFDEMRDALEGRKYVENYIQTMAHEIKSPLSAIRGAVELLEENMPPENRKQFLANIHNDSERIKDIINRLLQLSSLENRKELRDVEEIELHLLVDSVICDFKPLFLGKHISVDRKNIESLTVEGEIFLIRQSIVNMLQNSVEFSPDGGHITATVTKEDSLATIKIRDTGAGIPDYAIDKVFDKFYSLCRPNGKKSSGLGLAFIKEVSILHKGKATIKNCPEGGAEVSISLPC